MNCLVCSTPLCKNNKTGLCRSCGNKDPDRRKKNAEGVKRAHVRNPDQFSYFRTEQGRLKAAAGRLEGNRTKVYRAIESVFCKKSSAPNTQIRRYLLENLHWEYKCNKCGLLTWQGSSLAFDLDHIDGDSSNNEISNLRFLCPNCHSQTETFKGKNLNTGKKKVSDDELKKALTETLSVREALILVGLAPKGANYARAYKLKGQVA